MKSAPSSEFNKSFQSSGDGSNSGIRQKLDVSVLSSKPEVTANGQSHTIRPLNPVVGLLALFVGGATVIVLGLLFIRTLVLSATPLSDFTPSQWDNSDTIIVNKTIPVKRVYFVPDLQSARIVMDCEGFSDRFMRYMQEEMRYEITHELNTFLEDVERTCNSNDESDITSLTDSVYAGEFAFFELIEGRAGLFDIYNDVYVTYFTIDDKGFMAGPLAGQGVITYYLPDGTPFHTEKWIS